jgi:3'-5' exoribonuclease
MFHDIGKMDELSAFPENDYTDEGQLLGHIFIGTEIIGTRMKTIPNFPIQLGSELRHCILAHHGELEYGSPKKPAIVEALALNFADNTDAKIQTMTELFNNADDKAEWIGYNRFFESNIRRTTI